MKSLPVTAVVIPVYNQSQRLYEVVVRCLARVDRVWVVDDGSDEPVASLLEGLAVEVLRHEENRGKGIALCTAAAHLRALGVHAYDYPGCGPVSIFPEDLPLFLAAVDVDPDVLFLGVRDFENAEVPGASRFGAFLWEFLGTGTDRPQGGGYPDRLSCLPLIPI